jgi:phosphatidylglycerol:prolipoprotein diacylglycerol transferase
VVFPGERAQTCEGIIGDCARHPSQIYEAGLEGLLLFLVLISLVYMGFLKRPGFITGIFIAGYGSSRFFVEYFRVADPQFMTLDNPMGYAFIYGVLGIKMGQLLSVPMIVLGILFILFARREKNRAID